MADPVGLPVPGRVDERVKRGRRAMKRQAPQRRLCMRFTRGDTYSYVNEKGLLVSQSTVTWAGGGGKPPHRMRNTYNFIGPIVEDKVSSATQRVPAYEIDPATTDPEDIAAAKLAERVAIYGFDKWRIRQATVDTVKTAIAHGGVGYAMPIWDPNVGPYTQIGGRWVGEGEIKILTFNGNEAYSEPGCKWEDSDWWAVERAVPIDEVKELPGFVGGEISPDATTSDIPTDKKDRENLVMVTEYFERPCPKYPDGRWFTLAGGHIIVDYRLIWQQEQAEEQLEQPGEDGDDNDPVEPAPQFPWQPYPLRGADGEVIDEPLIHRLVYTHDPDTEGDLGLTWQLIDFQRTAQDCINKMLEYKNRGLNLQMIAPKGSVKTRRTDNPGDLLEFIPGPNGERPEWEKAPDAQILQALMQILNMILAQMKEVAAYEDVHADPGLAAKTASAVIEQSIARWQSFLGDLADWHSRLMRHCLVLVERYYSTPRTLEIRGRMGWEPVPDFRGADLMGQAHVRVSPGSLEYLSKQQIFQKVQYYASMGWINGQQAMAAIENGQAEKLLETYNLNVARVNRVIQRIRDGSVMNMPTRPQTDPATGQTINVPGWMPSDWDNLDIWQHTLADWMTSEDFEQLPPERQEPAKLMWQGLQDLQAQHAQRQAMQQNAIAEQLGMNNASKPQVPKPPPTQAGPDAQAA